MPYLVDGHNLIPKSGLRLEDVDDEVELIALLEEFARQERTGIDVYFDGAPPGSARSRRFGRVTAHFVRTGLTADAAITAHLKRLGSASRNWIVVSSDHQVQEVARRAHARSLRSEEFAKRLHRSERQSKTGTDEEARSEGHVSRSEVDEWLKLFKKEE